MRKVFYRLSLLLGSLTLALLIAGIPAVPNQALADGGGGGGNPPCSSCYNGCKGVSVPDCPGTNQGCNAIAGCGGDGSNCNCVGGGNPTGSSCVCF